MRKDRIVIARVMGGSRAADANAAAQDDGHFQTTAAHVLHFGYLVDQFAERIEDEVQEHEIHNRPRTGHGRTSAQTDEAALAYRGVAQALWAVQIEESGSGVEIATARPNALADDENGLVARHLLGQGLVRRFYIREFGHYAPPPWLKT